MSLNVPAAIDLALAAANDQPPLETLADCKTLYGVFQAVQAKTFDPAAMQKAGTFEPACSALARTAALLDTLVKDPKHNASVVALIASLV